VLVHRADVLALDADGAVRAALAKVPARIVVATNASPTADLSTHLLPGASFIEREGSWVNEDGRIQRFRRAYRPRDGTRDDLALIAGLSGGRIADRAPVIFDRLGAVHRRFSGIAWEDVGEDGIVPAADLEGVAV
jgi:predicted molibdopterin-dependent oxidoreductase YjgC